MRLTKNDKKAFVRAVMDDVPQVDYNEQARKLVMDWAISIMPPVVRQAYGEHPEYFENNYAGTPAGLFGAYVPVSEESRNIAKRDPEFWQQLVALGGKNKEQDTKIRELECKVRGIIESCSTLKTALERLPEFAKYLPADRDGGKITNLPVANTVTDLINAGWPKHKEAA